ncbi:MAG TPA: hypothetical protein DF712_09110 [Balneola sp.]|nr:hypothetical protein [Balneola sp.]|tara:strand:- start:91 stop:975 length:885 start_codon:yes stop_codon:yes gene_type:complete
MKAQFDQNILSSFYLWFENRLLNSNSKAYQINLSNAFTSGTFPDIPPTHIAFQGKYRQLVGEYNVDNPNSGFFLGSNFITGNYDENGGVFTDYDNGRLIFPQASGAAIGSTALTANSTVKEVNTYITNDTDAQTILHSDFKDSATELPYQYGQTEQYDEQTYFLPACFISVASSDNTEFSFGGEEDTRTMFRVMVLSFDNYTLDSVLSLFRDTVRRDITHIPYEDFPYGFSFSLKDYPYTYDNLVAAQSSPVKSHIKEVSVSKIVSERIREKLNKNISIGYIDFELCTYRFPRQ